VGVSTMEFVTTTHCTENARGSASRRQDAGAEGSYHRWLAARGSRGLSAFPKPGIPPGPPAAL
jgi:hypothetical protein